MLWWRAHSLLGACSQCLKCALIVLFIAASKPWKEPNSNQQLGSPTNLLCHTPGQVFKRLLGLIEASMSYFG